MNAIWGAVKQDLSLSLANKDGFRFWQTDDCCFHGQLEVLYEISRGCSRWFSNIASGFSKAVR